MQNQTKDKKYFTNAEMDNIFAAFAL